MAWGSVEGGMPEEVLFATEEVHSREEVASFFRTVAESLAAGEAITLRAGDDAVTMDPPRHVTFEVKAEREGPVDGSGELSVEFELEWDEDGSGSGPLEIE